MNLIILDSNMIFEDSIPFLKPDLFWPRTHLCCYQLDEIREREEWDVMKWQKWKGRWEKRSGREDERRQVEGDVKEKKWSKGKEVKWHQSKKTNQPSSDPLSCRLRCISRESSFPDDHCRQPPTLSQLKWWLGRSGDCESLFYSFLHALIFIFPYLWPTLYLLINIFILVHYSFPLKYFFFFFY